VRVTDSGGTTKFADAFIKWCDDKTRQLPNTGQPCTNAFTERQYTEFTKELKDGQFKELYWGAQVAGIECAAAAISMACPPAAPAVETAAQASAGVDIVEFKRLRDEKAADLRLYNQDPPDSATSAVALPRRASALPAPPCLRVSGRYAGQAERACAAVRPLFAVLINDTRQTTAILAAMLSTGNRFATALRANQQAAIALQEATTAILAVELSDALATERTAGITLARGLRARGLAPTFTRGQLKRLIGAIGRLHHFRPKIRALLGAAITPARLAASLRTDLADVAGNSFDLLTTLSRRKDTAALTAPNPAVTPAVVEAIVTALQKQGAISSANAGSLVRALNHLAGASGIAATSAALSEFTTAARHAAGPAGAFLLAAERALAAHS
jgi:hypothetical protein